jgi:hypothetical protein
MEERKKKGRLSNCNEIGAWFSFEAVRRQEKCCDLPLSAPQFNYILVFFFFRGSLLVGALLLFLFAIGKPKWT